MSTWSSHGKEGWMIEPVLVRYMCSTCYFPKTKSERVQDIVQFFPKSIPFQKITLDGFLNQTAQDIIDIITPLPSSIKPSLEAGGPTRNALKIAEILHRALNYRLI